MSTESADAAVASEPVVNDTVAAQDSNQEVQQDSVASDDGGDKTPEQQKQEETALLDMFGDESFRRKYRNDAEFRKGVKEMAAALSRRDEFAKYGKAVAQYENEFREFLMAKYGQQADQKPDPRQAQESAKTAIKMTPQEVALLKARVLDANGQVRENAKPEDIRKLQEVTELLEQRVYEYLLDPEGFLDKILEDKLARTQEAAAARARQEIEQMAADQAEVARINEFVNSNASWIFVNGKDASEGRTPLGEQFKTYVEEFVKEYSEPNGELRIPGEKLLQMAYWRLKAEQGDAISKPATKNKNVVRKPNSAPVNESLEARKAKKLQEARSLSEYYEWLAKENLEP